MTQLLTNKNLPRRRNPMAVSPWFPGGLMDFDRLFDTFFEQDGGAVTDTLGTRLDMTETDQAIEVKMDLPGVMANDVDIRVENNMLTVRGERKDEKEETDKNRQFHRIERRFGSFSRSVLLPTAVNDAEAVAEFNEGVLKIVLPKAEQAKSRKIAIR